MALSKRKIFHWETGHIHENKKFILVLRNIYILLTVHTEETSLDYGSHLIG